MDNLWMLFAAAGVMVAVIGGLSLLGDHYTLNNIKSKTVGDGQHGTGAVGYRCGDSQELCPRPLPSVELAGRQKSA